MYLNMILQTTFPTNTSLSKLETSPELVKSKYYTDIDLEGHEISHFGGLPRVIFSQGIIYFPKVSSTEGKHCPEEHMTVLAPLTCDISSIPVDICRWPK